MAASILMDARSIAATVRNGGYITAASDLDIEYTEYEYHYDTNYYKNQVFDNYGHADASVQIRKGPNIEDWPEIQPVNQHLLLKVAGMYHGSVTTDDLSPSGDAVAYRSNPSKLANFTMINKDPQYVVRSREIRAQEKARKSGETLVGEYEETVKKVCALLSCTPEDITIGGVLVGTQVGDGSSREQAASSQKILGGYADIAGEFATKRYRSNLINWGILPLVSDQVEELQEGQYLLIRNVQDVIAHAGEPVKIEVLGSQKVIEGNIGEMTAEEKEILSCGCLINYNRKLQGL